MIAEDRYFRGVNPSPNSDGWRMHACDLDRIEGYAEALEDLPTADEIDAVVADRCVTPAMLRRAAAIPTLRLLAAGRGVEDA